MIANAQMVSRHPKVVIWLFACVACVLLMVLIGGLTRLTESGLSMTEWHPFTGWVPPITDGEWHRIFNEYKKIPEFKYEHHHMGVEQFKQIFWLEFIHRLMGRITGLVVLLPLIYFWIRGGLRSALKRRLLALFCLGGVQGVIGWWMVTSGFADRTDVSQYRLTIHFMMAMFIFSLLLWTALSEAYRFRSAPWMLSFSHGRIARTYFFTWVVIGLIALQMAAGGLMAGLDAGQVSDTFPLMFGQWVPSELTHGNLTWVDHFENRVLVHFQHRWLGVTLLVAIFLLWLSYGGEGVATRIHVWRHHMLGMALVQMGLGIATIEMHVPIWLASMHQIGGVLLLAFTLTLAFHMKRVLVAHRDGRDAPAHVRPL